MSAMLHCWNCGCVRELDSAYAGKYVRCPACGEAALVPPDTIVHDLAASAPAPSAATRRAHPGAAPATQPHDAPAPSSYTQHGPFDPQAKPDPNSRARALAIAAQAPAATKCASCSGTGFWVSAALTTGALLALLLHRHPAGMAFAVCTGLASVIALVCGIGAHKRRALAATALVVCIVGAGMGTAHRKQVRYHPNRSYSTSPVEKTGPCPAQRTVEVPKAAQTGMTYAAALMFCRETTDLLIARADTLGGRRGVLEACPKDHATFLAWARTQRKSAEPVAALERLIEAGAYYSKSANGIKFDVNLISLDANRSTGGHLEFRRSIHADGRDTTEACEMPGWVYGGFAAPAPHPSDAWR